MPVASCSYGADFTISPGTMTTNFSEDGVHQISHVIGADRQGIARATVDGSSLGTSDVLFAYLGKAVSGYVSICHIC